MFGQRRSPFLVQSFSTLAQHWNNQSKSNQVYSLNLVTRHVSYRWDIYICMCLPGRNTVKLQHFFYPFTFLTIICISLDSFCKLVPLAFITWLKVKIEGCVNMRLPSNQVMTFSTQQRKDILIRNGTRLPLHSCGIKCSILNFCLLNYVWIFQQGVYDFDI